MSETIDNGEHKMQREELATLETELAQQLIRQLTKTLERIRNKVEGAILAEYQTTSSYVMGVTRHRRGSHASTRHRRKGACRVSEPLVTVVNMIQRSVVFFRAIPPNLIVHFTTQLAHPIIQFPNKSRGA